MNSLIPNMSKEEILALRAKEAVRGMSEVEMIREFYRSDLPIQLSKRQEEMRQKIDLCLRLQMQGLPISKIILMLKKTYNYKKDDQPRKIIKNTNFVYGEMLNADKNVKRAVAEEMALRAYRIAKKMKDPKGMNAAVANYIKLWALQNEDVKNPFDTENLKQSVYAIVLDDEVRKVILSMLSKGSVDLNSFMDNVEDIGFEEID